MLHVLPSRQFDLGATSEVGLVLKMLILGDLLDGLVHCEMLPTIALGVDLLFLRRVLQKHFQFMVVFDVALAS